MNSKLGKALPSRRLGLSSTLRLFISLAAGALAGGAIALLVFESTLGMGLLSGAAVSAIVLAIEWALDKRESNPGSFGMRERIQLFQEAENIGLFGDWHYDVKNDRMVWSDSLYRIHGVDPKSFETALSAIGALCHIDSRANWERFLETAIETGESASELFRFLKPNGDLLYAQVNVVCQKDRAGSVECIFGLTNDFSETIVAQSALRKSEERLDFALNAARMGTWDWDIRNRSVDCSDQVQTLFGLGSLSNPLCIRSCLRIIHPEDFAAVKERFRRSIEGSGEYRIEHRIKSKGEYVWVEVVGRVFKDENGIATRMAGTVWDIGSRKRTEQNIANYQANLLAVLENTADMILALNHEHLILMLNTSFRNYVMASYGIKLSVGDVISEKISADILKEWPARYDRALAGESFVVDDFFVVRGKRFYFEVSLNPIRENSQIIGISIMSRNITRRRATEASLLKAKEKAEESDQLKSAFLANMSHEIRTPMNGIMGFTQLLKAQNLVNDEGADYLDIIASNGAHLLELLGDIIDLAQLESRQISLNEGEFNLNMAMGETFSTFASEVAKRKGETVGLRLDNDVGDGLFVYGDETRIRQILYNLISNAIKFTRVGEIRFGYEIRDNERILFYVSDTGIGIEEKDLESVFDRFRQIEGGAASSVEGVGLGLAICSGLAKLLRGRIWVESTLGEGSIFRFELPLRVCGAKKSSAQSAVDRFEIDRDRSGTVLVAEDDDTNYFLLCEFLKLKGIGYVRASNGAEALSICEDRDDIVLVLMDMKMPVMDGFRATRCIKAIRPGLPVIAQTACSMKSERNEAILCGCSDYISKPIVAEGLYSVLGRFLGRDMED